MGLDYNQLAEQIKQWAKELGFADAGITDRVPDEVPDRLQQWLDKGYHGSMDYMARNTHLRADPAELLPGTLRVILVRMDYLPEQAGFARTLSNPELAAVSRYALGRDYHKLMRSRLKQLGQRIEQWVQSQPDYESHKELQDYPWRPFVDSAPVLERPLAERAGLGWTGKHSLLLEKSAGSWFFLGELLVGLPLPVDRVDGAESEQPGCGNCVACITLCPTQAIVEPYVVDARRCISYLTIEHEGAIPEELRPLLGNRIYGCDDCQLACPWSRFASVTKEPDFAPRHSLDHITLLALFGWSEQQFLNLTQGSPIRRIGYHRWQRNLAIALGNAPQSEPVIQALAQWLAQPEADTEQNAMVAEHIRWALERQRAGGATLSRRTERLCRVIEKGLPRDA